MSLLQLGPIRVKYSGTTYLLPPPDKGGLTLEWVKKESSVELLDGSERTRLLGFLPVLTYKAKIYAPDSSQASLDTLLGILSHPTGTIKVSPGKTAGGFTCDKVTVKPIGIKGKFEEGVEIVFRGRDIFSSMTSLGTF
jgi:hypothetical protein